MIEDKTDQRHSVRQPEVTSGLPTWTTGPPHIATNGTSPLTLKSSGPEVRNKYDELYRLAGNLEPQGSGVKRAQYSGNYFRAAPIIETVQ